MDLILRNAMVAGHATPVDIGVVNADRFPCAD